MKETLRNKVASRIASPVMTIGIGLFTMAGGGIYTSISDHNVRNKIEQPSLHEEIPIFNKNSLIARHVQVEANQRKPISRSSYTLWAGGIVLIAGIGWYLRQPAKAERKTNSE